MSGTPTLGDLIEVALVDTVVRLDGPVGRLGELVLTGDVVASLSAVLEVAVSERGAGFFVVGPFGSGKSHFLASVGELLVTPASASSLTGWDAELLKLAETARPSLAVAVPLVEYRAGAALEDVVAERAWRALGRPQTNGGVDRLAAWDGFLGAARADGHAGVVLLLDELSEFLRAKQGPTLTEDLRFLQFLGEWASGHPVLVLAALQENIEEVANVSQRELAKIRDRYRPSLTLSMRHVEDLVRGRLVRLRPGAETWVERAWRETAVAFSDAPLPHDRFLRCYPLHPDTLTLLEGLRFLLSQQRGVVDFICRRLGECLDRTYADLITPDDVFDHFRGRLHERAETARFADTVVPYFERAAEEVVDAEDRDLAVRTVKLLCLLAASPLERPRTASELAFMLLARVSDLDPAVNAAYLEHAVLGPLVDRGAYVVAEVGPPRTYTVALDADAALVARTRVDQTQAEISPGDRRLVATLVGLGSSPPLPLQLLAEIGPARREFLWQNTLRSLVVGAVRILDFTAEEALASVTRARAAGAAGCLLIGEVELDEAEAAAAAARAAALVASTDRLAIWVPGALRPDERDALLGIHSRRLVLRSAADEARADVVEVLERAGGSDAAVAREILRRAYFEGRVQSPGAPLDLSPLAGLAFERQLPSLADPLLGTLHPLHLDVAPRGELVGDRVLRQALTDVITPGRLGPAAVARGQLRSMIESYLVPLGLARVRNDGFALNPDPARSTAVAEALRLVGDGEPVASIDVVAGLADGPLGLTGPEALLVLNACVRAGLLEAWRGRRRHTEPFLAVTDTDRLGPGELVELDVREAVVAAAPIFGPGPFDPWTAGAQRGAWDYAKAWIDARRDDLAQCYAGLVRFGEVPALATSSPDPVHADVANMAELVKTCSPPTPMAAPAGLRQLAAAIVDPEALLATARRLGAIARFFRDDLRRVEECATFLTHPELTIPPAHEALVSMRDAAIAMLGDTLALAARDRIGDLLVASRDFRSGYLATYSEAHGRHYTAVSQADVDAFRSTPAYRALARLSSIGASAVPDDRVRVDRVLVAATPLRCQRRVDVEIAWKPRCGCGFALGDPEPSLDTAAVVAMAERGVGQHLVELARPEHRARLTDATQDLTALGRHELAADGKRLAAILTGTTRPVDLGVLVSLLGDDLVGLMRDVLTGNQLIATRDLAALREDLIGRRYPKARLIELLAAWVDPVGDMATGGFVEVIDSTDAGSAGAAGRD